MHILENFFGIFKPTVIKQIQKIVDKDLWRLNEIEKNSTTWKTIFPGYQKDNTGKIIGLMLCQCGLKEFPKEVIQLPNLQRLNLSNNRLSQLPKEIGQLQSLQILNLSNNELHRLPEEIGQLQSLQILNLGNNKLHQLPEEIGQLQGLQILDLGNNELHRLPEEIGQLQSLQTLILSGNKLTKLPEETQQLQNLQILDLSNNQLTQLPMELLQLNLDIKRSNWLGQRGEDGLYVEGNPFRIPPIEIVKRGRKAIIAYYNALSRDEIVEDKTSKQPELITTTPSIKTENPENQEKLQEQVITRSGHLHELKLLLIGDGGAGKTSLLKLLLGHPFDPNESQTHGINLNTLDMEIPTSTVFSAGGTVKLHCWDFGGQEIMHATHQFFLSKRGLYVLVLDSRHEAKPDYWLKHIQSFGDKSPIILVINKIDENPSFDLPRQPLQKYNITHTCRLSCRTGEGLDALKQAIQQTLPQVELVQTPFPPRWWQVKTALEQFSTQGRDFLSYDHYLDLCRQHEVTNDSEQQTLIEFLHDLGLVIHFDQKLLRETNIINPKWLTEAVYKLITAPQVIQQQGVLFTHQLKELLDTRIYPSHKHDYLLELLKTFERCYAVTPDTLLFPDLLPVVEPRLPIIDDPNPLKLVLQYDFLPKSIFTRFMVRMHCDIDPHYLWRTGMLLREDNYYKITALVCANETDKKITIDLSGSQKRDYLVVLLYWLRDIHTSFEALTVDERISLPDNPAITVSYAHLLELEQEGETEIRPEGTKKKYNIKDLLGTVYNRHLTNAEFSQLLKKLVEGQEIADEKTFWQKFGSSIELKIPFILGEVNLKRLVREFFGKRGK